MRRALLTARAATVPVTVGNSTDTPTGASVVYVLWTNYAPANATGFLNTVRLNASNNLTSDYAVFTISPANIVTDISATITTDRVVDINTIALAAPLAVNSGDYLGMWFSGAPGGIRYSTAPTGNGIRYINTGAIAKPAPGATITPDGNVDSLHWLLSATT